MKLWIDAQLSPHLASWITDTFGIDALAVGDIGLRDAEDREIYLAAREAQAIVVTKDRDFLFLLDQYGPPPQVLWVVCGNASNAYLRGLLERTLPDALNLLESTESLVVISDAQ